MRKGENNPMYNKPKSDAFLYHQTKFKGVNNPMYGKNKAPPRRGVK